MGKRTFIIAEAGVNHNGNIETAMDMVSAAVKAGADAVKFQTFKADRIVSKSAKKAAYQLKTSNPEESQFDMLKRLELSATAHEELIKYCEDKKIQFLSSPFDLESIDLLVSLGLDIFKIPSGEITNLPYLRKIGNLKKKILLSTGMADLNEIAAAIDVLSKKAGTALENITVLHCNTEYPTPMHDVNLNAMQKIATTFPEVQIGYSDHTQGIEVPIAAVALGASVIEKHFTLDREMNGPDHKASVEPKMFKKMVIAIRNIELAMGDGNKKATKSELKNRSLVRKSIVAAKEIKIGQVFNQNNLTTKRPATGMSPMEWDALIGKTAKKNYSEGENI